MKTILSYKKCAFFLLLFLFKANTIISQVGINTTSPSPGSMLDVESTDKGILIPRVDIADLSTIDPITGGNTESLLVYNTNTTTSKGFYYWDGVWINIDNGDWEINGNAGTNPTNNFIGTTDDVGFVVRTNNVERMAFSNIGNVGIGAAPYSNVALRVSNSAQPFGIIGETNSSNASIYGIQSGGGIGVLGSNTGSGVGVFGVATSSHGMYATSSYTGGSFLTAGISAWGTGDNNASAVLATTDKVVSSSQSNIAIRAISGGTLSIQPSGGMNIAINANAIDLGLNVLTESSSGIREAARFKTNFAGSATNADASDMRARLAGYTDASEEGGEDMYYGGYFYSGGDDNGSWAYAGARYDDTNYKIIGNGSVSTIVDGVNENDTKKVMFAPEAPEVLFEDYGTGKLVNGTATITIDPIFSNNITINEEHPLRVFIQLEGDCKGVYVTNKTANSFVVKELQNGSSSTPFSWHIVANRKNETNHITNEVTVYESLRFPDAPSKIEAEAMESKSVKGVEEAKTKPLELKEVSPTKN